MVCLVDTVPVLTVEPEPTRALVGSAVRLDCRAKGTPEPSLYWRRQQPDRDHPETEVVR